MAGSGRSCRTRFPRDDHGDALSAWDRVTPLKPHAGVAESWSPTLHVTRRWELCRDQSLRGGDLGGIGQSWALCCRIALGVVERSSLRFWIDLYQIPRRARHRSAAIVLKGVWSCGASKRAHSGACIAETSQTAAIDRARLQDLFSPWSD